MHKFTYEKPGWIRNDESPWSMFLVSSSCVNNGGERRGDCSVWLVTTGDHELPGVSTHIMQTSAAELATADIHCSPQMWDWRLQRNLRPRLDLCEQLRAHGKEEGGNSRPGPLPASGQLLWRHCLTLPGIASHWSTVASAGSEWAASEK